VAQCFPVKREAWGMRTEVFTDEQAQAAHEVLGRHRPREGVYRKRFRA